jgi:excinuclease UvrABC nuclease subunit
MQLEQEMLKAAEELDFEKAAALRDHIKELKVSPEAKISATRARPDRESSRAAGGDQWKPKSQHRRPKARKK